MIIVFSATATQKKITELTKSINQLKSENKKLQRDMAKAMETITQMKNNFPKEMADMVLQILKNSIHNDKNELVLYDTLRQCTDKVKCLDEEIMILKKELNSMKDLIITELQSTKESVKQTLLITEQLSTKFNNCNEEITTINDAIKKLKTWVGDLEIVINSIPKERNNAVYELIKNKLFMLENEFNKIKNSKFQFNEIIDSVNLLAKHIESRLESLWNGKPVAFQTINQPITNTNASYLEIHQRD